MNISSKDYASRDCQSNESPPAGGTPLPTGSAKPTTRRTSQACGVSTRRGDIIAKSRTPFFTLCRELVATGANPDSSLECYRGPVMCIWVKSIGIGAKLTIKENDFVGPKVVPYERS